MPWMRAVIVPIKWVWRPHTSISQTLRREAVDISRCAQSVRPGLDGIGQQFVIVRWEIQVGFN